MASDMIGEKLRQAAELVAASDLDVWLTFVRETSGHMDPALPFLTDAGLTWESALMVFRSGRRIAVVGNYDADPLRHSGHWDDVVPFVRSIGPELRQVLEAEITSETPRIGVNYSLDDDKADGLTHGMYLRLEKLLSGTRFESALVSAEDLVCELRGVKSPGELAHIGEAVAATLEAFARVPGWSRKGMSERELYDQIQGFARANGYGFSWEESGDPIVNFGPNSMIGHGVPSSTLALAEKLVLHIDLGLLVNGYASDLQRCWFTGRGPVPTEVEEALSAVNAAIDAGAERLRPGVQGVDVDAAARAEVIRRGFPEYLHALGHQVGRMAHDGGGLLGPAWDRYGQSPFRPVQEGQVYTLELGITLESYGYVGIEEMVRVGSDGVEWLAPRQTSMPLLPI
jgi:Xaa-Pro aminopeptidase